MLILASRNFLEDLALVVTIFLTAFLIRAADPVGFYLDFRLPRSIGTLQSVHDSWIERARGRPHPRNLWHFVGFIGLAMAAVMGIAIGY